MSHNVQDDDPMWIEYLNEAAKTDARLIDDWTKVIDVILVFVGLFIGVLTAFIIQISNNFKPNPAEVTNMILIAIYNRTMNDTAPLDFGQFLSLDDSSRRTNELQNWLLYTSLVLCIVVAVLAMATKMWVVNYSRVVATTEGLPHERAKKRQQAYDGSVEWALGECIDSMPIIAIIAVGLFGFFIYYSVSERQKSLANFVTPFFHVAILFIVLLSSITAFIPSAPFRSIFSDLTEIAFRGFKKRADKWITGSNSVRWGPPVVVLLSIPLLVAGGYFLLKQNFVYFVCIYIPVLFLPPLLMDGEGDDRWPRIISLPFWVLISFIIICGFFLLSVEFATHSTLLCLLFFTLASVMLYLLGVITMKMSERKPNTRTVEARAVSWLLQTSLKRDPAWFLKAVEIAGESPNIRALLIQRLFPLLSSLIIRNESEQRVYIHTLARLLDFKEKAICFLSNEASLKRPDPLPDHDDLLDKLKKSQKCSHMGGSNNAEGSKHEERSPYGCDSDMVDNILRLFEPKDQEKTRSADTTDVV